MLRPQTEEAKIKMEPQNFIEIRDLRKKYRLGETFVDALRGVNLDLKKGEFTALVGASGSGKSTLLNMIACLDEPDSGSILIGNQDTTKLNESQKCVLRNEGIGFVFQSFHLVPVLTVYENVELPLLVNKSIPPEQHKERVLSLIRDVGLKDMANKRPDTLSGGQRQRVAIARALVTNPGIVLADEPTANLDSKTTHEIIDLLLALNQKNQVTFLFSTHDEKLMSRAMRTIHLRDGTIFA
jgi:putative ABC transport system ATP-binding protein